MTDRKDLKRRIRERVAKTGESYTAARAHVLAQRPEPASVHRAEPVLVTPPGPALGPFGAIEPRTPTTPFDVVEPLDLDDVAATLGFACAVRMFPSLAAVVSPAAVLTRLRDVLMATEGDSTTRVLRSCVFRGEAPAGGAWSHELAAQPKLRSYLLRNSVARGDLPDEKSVPQERGRLRDLHEYLARVRAGIGGASPGGSMLALPILGHSVLAIASVLRAPRGGEPRPCLWLHASTESLGTFKITALLAR